MEISLKTGRVGNLPWVVVEVSVISALEKLTTGRSGSRVEVSFGSGWLKTMRCRYDGVKFGRLKSENEEGVVLTNATQRSV